MPEILLGVSAVAGIAGTIVQGKAQREAGVRAQEAANIQADQLEDLAGEEYAAAQREGFETDRQTELLEGTAVAASAAGGVGGGTNERLRAEVLRLGRYRRNLALYGGLQRGKGLVAQARATRRSGQAALEGARLAAFGTVLAGVSNVAGSVASFYSNYGGGGMPSKDPKTAGVPSWLQN